MKGILGSGGGGEGLASNKISTIFNKNTIHISGFLKFDFYFNSFKFQTNFFVFEDVLFGMFCCYQGKMKKVICAAMVKYLCLALPQDVDCRCLRCN
jgi:hypothetical protein